ncbi:SubName: Full=Related to WD40-repeat protein (Notchless protein) {ECO:0000313/EMBL:CCA75956.1} [Serendipita indica DSM 11827]|nr:SubName: Full=Related to WD40-repeat protein (Notchless protein) {ECO:0000313/EMBL:CCA75956.1} [Serendipita indica DSM 11827]
MAFSVPIQDSAPHIYISAIPFTPKNSELHHEGRTKYAGALAVTQGLEEVYAGLPRTLRGHQLAFNAVAISPDGSCIVSGSSDWTIRIWDADTGQPLGEPLRGHALQLLTVAISPEGPKIVSDSRDMTIRLWDVGTGQQLGETLQGHTHSIFSGSNDATIRVWDVDTGRPLGTPFLGHKGPVFSVDISPDGSRIVSGSFDTTVRLWDVETRQPVGEPLHGHWDRVMAVTFSSDGSRIASCSSDKTIRLWDVATGQPLGEPLRGHSGQVNAVSFSPNGSRIVSASSDRTIWLWDAEKDINTNVSTQKDGELVHLELVDSEQGIPLEISVPGFKICSLLHNGWVPSSRNFLFWVPPANRHGLRYPHLLTIPTKNYSQTTFAYPSATLAIYTGTTSFVDPLTTVIQPVIILAIFVKAITTGSRPTTFTRSVATFQPITLTGGDIVYFTTTSSAIQAFPTSSSDLEPVTSTSTYYVPFTSETTRFFCQQIVS